ncbi:MAG: DUF2339 domain-containing protein [Phycisphaerae bacterium]|jgi:uncharacterized membrane protein
MRATVTDLQRRVTQLEAARPPVPADTAPVPAPVIQLAPEASAPGQRAAAFLAAQQAPDIIDHEFPYHVEPPKSSVAPPPPSPTSAFVFTKMQARAAEPRNTPASFAQRNPQPQPAPAPRTGINFEELLAGRWYAALGAIAVVIAASLFVKLGYDQGWLRVAPLWRCLGAGAFGITLVALAEFVRKRWGSWAACGSASAGLGTIYASVYAAHKLFNLLQPAQGVAIMLAVAIFGTVIGVRMRLTFIVAVSLAGGYLAPILMRGPEVAILALPAYVLCLMVIGLASSTWLEHKHTVKSSALVRVLATGGAAILLSLWSLSSVVPLTAGLIAVALAWLLVHADAVINAWLAKQPAEAHEDDRLPADQLFRAQSLAFAVLATTSWAVGLAMFLLAQAGSTRTWMVPLAVCTASAMLAGVLAPFGASISRLPATLRHVLGQVMLVQFALLLIVVIAAALGGYAQITAFAVIGLAAAVMGPRLASKPMRVYGLILLSLATLIFLLTRVFAGPAGFASVSIAGLVLTVASLVAVLLACIWTVALAVEPDEPSMPAAFARACLPIMLLLLAPLHANAHATSILWIWIGLTLLLSFFRAPRALRLDLASLLVALASAALWLLLFASYMLDAGWFITPAAHIALAGIALAAITSFITWRNRTQLTDRALVLHSACGMLAFAASSLAVSAVTQQLFTAQTSTRGAVSVWWAIAAVLTLAAGFRWANASLRYIGLALLGLTAGKVVFYDLTAVSPVWRIATFLVVGLIMMGVAFVYGRLSRQSGAVEN